MYQPNHRTIAATLSARALASLSESGLEPPAELITSTAHGEIGGWQVTTIICRFDGPARFYPKENQKATPLREIEQTILEAAPGPDEAPIRIEDLRAKAGYGKNRHFAKALDRLLELELLVRTSLGVKRSQTSP